MIASKKMSHKNANTKNQKPPQASIIYLIISYCIVFPIFRVLLRGRVTGQNNVPQIGPIVVVANHGSHLDPPLLGHALGRPLAFMAKQELFSIPVLGQIIQACGAYPVHRGASDRAAIRTASNRLNENWAIGVFLDGTRQKDGRIIKPMPGAALLAARTGASLLPVAIVNSHRVLGTRKGLPRLLPIHLRIGKTIPPPENRNKEDLKATTEKLKNDINSLLDLGIINN